MISEEGRAKLREGGRRGGLAKVRKGFAVSGKASEAGIKGNESRKRKYGNTQGI